MLSFLKKQLANWDRMTGIELVLLAEGFEGKACLLEKHKGTVRLVRTLAFQTAEELNGFLEPGTPISISLSGRGILHKPTDNGTETDPARLIGQVVPNAKAEEFYLQLVAHAASPVLSLVRKTMADEAVSAMSVTGSPLVALSLGGLAMCSLFPLLADTGSLHLPRHQFTWKDGELVKYDTSLAEEIPAKELVIGGQKVPVAFGIAYATALQQFLPEQVVAVHSPSADAKGEALEKRLFVRLGWGVLLFFLSVLVLNFLFFSMLSQTAAQLTEAAGLNKSRIQRLATLTKETGEKEKFLKEAGWMQTPKSSFYADRIAATVPASVNLLQLSVNPLDVTLSRDQRKQVFHDGLIVLRGTCKTPIDLNAWIRRLKDFVWAKKVHVEHYRYDSADRTGHFNVEIRF